MNEIWKVIKRFLPPYKRYLVLNIIFNVLAAVLTLFSFAVIIPILEMLFQIKTSMQAILKMCASTISTITPRSR